MVEKRLSEKSESLFAVYMVGMSEDKPETPLTLSELLYTEVPLSKLKLDISPAAKVICEALERASDPPPPEVEGPTPSPFISYDDFQKVVIRVGEVKEASRIEKSKGGKLLKLTVDFNEISTRTVVSGIGLTFKPEQLVARKFAFVTNLKPNSIMGVESHAMILATGLSDQLTLCSIPNEVPNGSRLG